MHARALVVTHGFVLTSTKRWSENAQCVFLFRRKGAPGHRPRALPMWGVPHQSFDVTCGKYCGPGRDGD